MTNVNMYLAQYRNIVRQDSDLLVPREIRAFGYYGIHCPPIKSILLMENNGEFWYRCYYSRSVEELPPVYQGAMKQNVSGDFFDLKKFPTPEEAWNWLKTEFALAPSVLTYIDLRQT